MPLPPAAWKGASLRVTLEAATVEEVRCEKWRPFAGTRNTGPEGSREPGG